MYIYTAVHQLLVSVHNQQPIVLLSIITTTTTTTTTVDSTAAAVCAPIWFTGEPHRQLYFLCILPDNFTL